MRISKIPEDNATIIDLLLISDEVGKQHYCLIKSLSRLLSSQTSKSKEIRYYCRRRLGSYSTVEKLKSHRVLR